jgi:hypothetical protein
MLSSRKFDGAEIPKLEFDKLLVDLEIIEDHSKLNDAAKKASNLRYLENEYADQKEAVVVKELEDDFEYFVRADNSVIKNIVSLVLEKLIQLNASVVSTIEALLESSCTEKQNVSISRTNWVHSYDFVRWFAKEVEQGEVSELINLFISYMTTNQENQHLLSIPKLLGLLEARIDPEI